MASCIFWHRSRPTLSYMIIVSARCPILSIEMVDKTSGFYIKWPNKGTKRINRTAQRKMFNCFIISEQWQVKQTSDSEVCQLLVVQGCATIFRRAGWSFYQLTDSKTRTNIQGHKKLFKLVAGVNTRHWQHLRFSGREDVVDVGLLCCNALWTCS
jgi:hypothetical protein